MDFHHTTDNKEFTIASAINKINKKKLWEEIEKCIVVCANCHRKIHAGILIYPEV